MVRSSIVDTDVGAATKYQSPLESEASVEQAALHSHVDQALRHSPSLEPDRERYVIASPAPRIEDAPTGNQPQVLIAAPKSRPTGNESETESSARVYQIPKLRLPEKTFRLLQQWRGTVTEVGESEFDADLCDLTNPANPRETSTFAFDELSPGDEQLVRVGAVFYWCIGYELSRTRQRTTVSQIIFRRLPGWARSDAEAVKHRAAEIAEILGIENT